MHILAFSVKSRKSRAQRLAFRVQDLVSRVQRPESSIQSPASRVQRPASRVQRPESRVQKFRYARKKLYGSKLNFKIVPIGITGVSKCIFHNFPQKVSKKCVVMNKLIFLRFLKLIYNIKTLLLL